MKILLDESVPQKLRLLIKGNYTVVTAWFQGWSGLKNGALLDAAEKTGFGLFITADQALSYQQNLTGRTIALVVLSTNNWSFIKAHVAEIMRVSIHLSALRPTLQSSIVFAERIGMRALQRSLQSRTHLSRSANNIHRAARRIATCLMPKPNRSPHDKSPHTQHNKNKEIPSRWVRFFKRPSRSFRRVPDASPHVRSQMRSVLWRTLMWTPLVRLQANAGPKSPRMIF